MSKTTQPIMAENVGPEGQPARRKESPDRVPVIAVDLPVMYEDEGQDEMGETDIHWRCCEILRNGLIAHLGGQQKPFRVFSDLNVYYHPLDRGAYVSPDVCAVFPANPLPLNVTSYRIGKDGPAPIICMEVMSHRSAQQQDLGNKLAIYAELGVQEYIVVDVTGMYFPRQLLSTSKPSAAR
jgi:Uma2 family endonuclease